MQKWTMDHQYLIKEQQKRNRRKIILVIAFLICVISLTSFFVVKGKNQTMIENIEVGYKETVQRYFGSVEDSKPINGTNTTVTNKTITPPGTIIGLSSVELEWEITKTDSEQYLDVTYDNVNDNTTEFCITFNDKVAYENDLSLSAKQITDVPLNKTLLEGNFTVAKAKVDLSKATDKIEECFNVTYAEKISGMQLKIGWGSVSIDSSATTLAANINTNENIVRDSKGVLHVAYEGADNDLWYGNSTDDGERWSTRELLAGTVETVGIIIDSNDYLFVYFDNGDLDFFNSTDGGATWSSIYTGFDMTATIEDPSCAMDASDYYHCCFSDDNDDGWYGNSSALDINYSITNQDFDWCDIEVDETGNAHIAAVGTSDDDLDFWTTKTGFGEANKISIDPTLGTAVAGYGPALRMTYDGNVYITYIADSDLQFANSTTGAGITNWDLQEIASTISTTPDVSVDNNGHIHILYSTNTILTASSIIYRFSRNGGQSWPAGGTLTSTSNYPTIADSLYPMTSNNVSTSDLQFVYNENTGKFTFNSIEVNSELVEDNGPPCDWNAPNSANHTYKFNDKGKRLDCSGDGNGTIQWNFMRAGVGKFNNSANFTRVNDDSANDPAGLGTVGQMGDNWTFSYWGNFTAGDSGRIVSKSTGSNANRWDANIGVGAANKASMNYKGGVIITTDVEVANSTWVHIVFVKSSGYITAYVNGVDINNVSDANTWTGDTAPLCFGQNRCVDLQFTTPHQVDEIRIWENYPLTATEVLELYEFEESTTPVIINLANDSTTNVTTNINWSCSLGCNYTATIWNHTDDFSMIRSEEDTFNLSWSINFSGLTNNTAYYINLSVWGNTGEIATNLSNFTFTTAQFVGVSDTCTYTSGDWIMDCTDECAISTEEDLGGNDFSWTGEGTVTISGKVFNYVRGNIAGGCNVNCISGGCFG